MKIRPVLFAVASIFGALQCFGDDLPPLSHMGRPLSSDEFNANGITVGTAPYPTSVTGEMVSKDGHRCALDMRIGGSGHTNDTIFYFHSPVGKDVKLEFRPTYWETSDCHWVNEDLFFVRIWWGRRWGSDYIFDADTQKIVYAEGISEPREDLNSKH